MGEYNPNGDAEWFNCRPHRTHRLREAFDEDLDRSTAPFVLVRQLAPGHYARLSIELDGDMTPAQLDDDALAVLFEWARHGCRGTLYRIEGEGYGVILRGRQ